MKSPSFRENCQENRVTIAHLDKRLKNCSGEQRLPRNGVSNTTQILRLLTIILFGGFFVTLSPTHLARTMLIFAIMFQLIVAGDIQGIGTGKTIKIDGYEYAVADINSEKIMLWGQYEKREMNLQFLLIKKAEIKR